jgi:tetratricopeptide (TPR) repeat protein
LAVPRTPRALWHAAAVLLALACWHIPLLDAVDVDFAIALALFASVCGGALAVTVTRARPDADALTRGLAATLAALGPVAVAAGLLGLLTIRCADWIGWAFVFWLAPVSALCGAAAGTIAADLTPKRRAHAVTPLVVLVSIVLAVARAFGEGIAVAYSPFFGFFPGPIYDELADLPYALVAYRVYCVGWAAFALAAWGLRRRPDRPSVYLAEPSRPSIRPLRGLLGANGSANGTEHQGRSPRVAAAGGVSRGERPTDGRSGRWPVTRSRAAFVLLSISALGVVAGLVFGRDLGFRPGREAIGEALSGQAESAHFRYRFTPGSIAARDAGLYAEDHEFRYAQDARFLEAAPPGKIDAYLYASASQKKRLTGAGDTLFADVHGAAFHVQATGFPIPALKHELIHVMARPFSMPVVPSTKVALIEGLAVAAEGFRGDLAVPQWARAMRDLGKAPDLAAIMGPVGFWTQQGSRAYLLTGSFVAFLRDRYGAAKVRDVYAWGNFDEVYGKPLADLKAEWEKSLDGVAVSDLEKRRAEDLFARGGIFDRPCARCVARLTDRADRALADGETDRAAALYRKALAIQPGNAPLRLDLARALAKARDFPGARAEIARVTGSDAPAIRRAEGRLLRGDVAYLEANADAARADWAAVRDADASSDLTRQAVFRLAALDLGDDGHALLRAVVGPDFPSLADLLVFADEHKGNALAAYLAGRRAVRDREWKAAESALARAVDGLPGDVLAAEAWRLLGTVRYRTDLPGAIEAFGHVSTLARSTGERMAASEWIERCVWATRYRAAVSAPDRRVAGLAP